MADFTPPDNIPQYLAAAVCLGHKPQFVAETEKYHAHVRCEVCCAPHIGILVFYQDNLKPMTYCPGKSRDGS